MQTKAALAQAAVSAPVQHGSRGGSRPQTCRPAPIHAAVPGATCCCTHRFAFLATPGAGCVSMRV